MLLMPKEIKEKLPALYATEKIPAKEKRVELKLFDPSGRWTMFVVEFDGEDTLFGYIVSMFGPDCDEWGYASLSEIQQTRNRFGLKMERDLYFKPRTLQELVEREPALKRPIYLET